MLVPLMLTRLRELQQEAEQEREVQKQDKFRRPFALFSKSPLKNPRRLSSDVEGEDHEQERVKKQRVDQDQEKVKPGSMVKLAPGWPNGLNSPPRLGLLILLKLLIPFLLQFLLLHLLQLLLLHLLQFLLQLLLQFLLQLLPQVWPQSRELQQFLGRDGT